MNGIILSDSAIASITSIAATFLDAEGEKHCQHNSLNDTNYLGNWWKAMPTSCPFWPMPGTDKLDNLGLAYIPLIRSPFVAMVSMDSPLASMKSVTMDDLLQLPLREIRRRLFLVGLVSIERVCQEHGYAPHPGGTRAHLHELLRYSAGCGRRHDLQASMPQLRYLSDFSVTVLPVTDDDALPRLYAIYKKTTTNACGRPLDAYTRARKIILNHGKGGTTRSTASSRAQGKAALNGQIRMPAAQVQKRA